MILAAWRKVGFAGGRIDAQLIDRTHFIDRIDVGGDPDSSPARGTRATLKSIEEVVQTPEGLRRGSLAAIAAKLNATLAHIMEQGKQAEEMQKEIELLHTAPFDPETVPFLMKPKEITAKKKRDRSQVDMSLYEGGSASLRNVRKTQEAKRAAVEEKRAAVDGRKEERAGKKAEETAASLQLVADFERCAESCVCGQNPCPTAALKPCFTCKAAGRMWIKPRMCVVRECVAARKGEEVLAITYEEGLTPEGPMPIARLMFEPMTPDEADCAADEVMPAAKAIVARVTLCDWACECPEMTAEEVELGYCSGRRCKAKMHPACFLHHTGAAGAAVGDLDCFCQACWAKQ